MIDNLAEQKTKAWWDSRRGLCTASSANKLVTPTGKISASHVSYGYALAADIYAGESLDAFAGNYHTERGNSLEGDARNAYAFFRDVDVVETGFHTDDALTCGASPDGLVNEDGLLEIKALAAHNHVAALMAIRETGLPPADYLNQIQMQAWILGREWVDWCCYHPSLPLGVVRVRANPELHVAMREAVTKTIAVRDHALATMRELAGIPLEEAA